jgi:hypothetical protein
VLLPAHAFKTNDELQIQALEQTMDIKLGGIKDHTGSFTQFQFSSQEEAKRNQQLDRKSAAEKNKDDFDEIWSTL